MDVKALVNLQSNDRQGLFLLFRSAGPSAARAKKGPYTECQVN